MEHSPTIELAKKLNAIELIDVSRASPRNAQIFDYLLVLDFEATCWEYSATKTNKNEVIEFSAVLYNVKNAQIVDEYQQYVQPTEFPILSDFCTNLTGITQSQVNDAVQIGTCLTNFTKWVNKHESILNFSFITELHAQRKRKCVFVTWSDWDLGICLKKECRRKNIHKPDFFNKWIDLRKIYTEHYLRRPQGLIGALGEVGLEFVGNQHCGLDDAKNTAYLAGKLIEDGASLRVTNLKR